MNFNIKLFFDQSFANSHKKQLLWLFVLMGIAIVLLLGISYMPGMYFENGETAADLSKQGDEKNADENKIKAKELEKQLNPSNA